MRNKLLRHLILVRCIPHRPYKMSARQLQVKLAEQGIRVSLRTLQRDLEEMVGMGLFDLTSDDRCKPYGWCFEGPGYNFTHIMPLALAVALRTWSDQASQLLPVSVLTELNPLVDKANKVIRDSQSELAHRWIERIQPSLRQFAGNPDLRHSTLIREALWRGHKFSAEVLRLVKQRSVWLCYDHINPLGILNQRRGATLLCTLSELDPKIYGIPFSHLKSVVLTNVSATQPTGFNIKKLVREQGYLDVCGPTCCIDRIDAYRPLVDHRITGCNLCMSRYDTHNMVEKEEYPKSAV